METTCQRNSKKSHFMRSSMATLSLARHSYFTNDHMEQGRFFFFCLVLKHELFPRPPRRRQSVV